MRDEHTVVIGGTGFIGEYIVRAIGELGHAVSSFGRSSEESLEHIVKRSSAVVYLLQPEDGVLEETLAWIEKSEVSTFLYASTLLVYEEGETARDESGAILPIGLYAKKKYAEEKRVLQFAAEHPEIRVLVTRLGNVYGDVKNKGFIGRVLNQLVASSPSGEIILAGDGTQLRDYVLVDDVAAALACLLDDGTTNGVVNIATGIGTTLLEIIEAVERVSGKKVAYAFGPAKEEARSIIGSPAKLATRVVWNPCPLIEDGLRKTYERYIVKAT